MKILMILFRLYPIIHEIIVTIEHLLKSGEITNEEIEQLIRYYIPRIRVALGYKTTEIDLEFQD